MDKNKMKYCTLLLIDDDNHSKTFISEKNKYYIRDDNETIRVKMLNKFEDIRKFFCKINVIDISDNYYKIDDKPHNIKHCTLLLINDDNHSKIFIPEKNLYNTICIDGKYYDYDNDNYSKIFISEKTKYNIIYINDNDKMMMMILMVII